MRYCIFFFFFFFFFLLYEKEKDTCYVMLCNGRSKLKLIFLIGEHLNGHYIYAVSSLDAETLKKYHSFTEKNNHTLKISTTLSFNPQAFRSKKHSSPHHFIPPTPSSRPSSFTKLKNHPSLLIRSQPVIHPGRVSRIPLPLPLIHPSTPSFTLKSILRLVKIR